MGRQRGRDGFAGLGWWGPGIIALALALGIASSAAAQTCVHPQGAVPFGTICDVDQSGSATVADAVCIILIQLQYQAGGDPSSVACLGSGNPITADVSCDGSVNVVDALACVTSAIFGYLPPSLNPDAQGCPEACGVCAPEGESSCLIGGACVPEGAADAANSCLVCDPASDATAYTTQVCTTYFLDADGDGFGVDGQTDCTCASVPPYTAVQGGDCQDGDGAIKPGAVDICGNGVDENCSGAADEGCALLCDGTESLGAQWPMTGSGDWSPIVGEDGGTLVSCRQLAADNGATRLYYSSGGNYPICTVGTGTAGSFFSACGGGCGTCNCWPNTVTETCASCTQSGNECGTLSCDPQENIGNTWPVAGSGSWVQLQGEDSGTLASCQALAESVSATRLYYSSSGNYPVCAVGTGTPGSFYGACGGGCSTCNCWPSTVTQSCTCQGGGSGTCDNTPQCDGGTSIGNQWPAPGSGDWVQIASEDSGTLASCQQLATDLGATRIYFSSTGNYPVCVVGTGTASSFYGACGAGCSTCNCWPDTSTYVCL